MDSGAPILFVSSSARSTAPKLVYLLVQIAVVDAPLYPVPVYLDAESRALVHGSWQRLGAAYAAGACGEADAAAQRSQFLAALPVPP